MVLDPHMDISASHVTDSEYTEDQWLKGMNRLSLDAEILPSAIIPRAKGFSKLKTVLAHSRMSFYEAEAVQVAGVETSFSSTSERYVN